MAVRSSGVECQNLISKPTATTISKWRYDARLHRTAVRRWFELIKKLSGKNYEKLKKCISIIIWPIWAVFNARLMGCWCFKSCLINLDFFHPSAESNVLIRVIGVIIFIALVQFMFFLISSPYLIILLCISRALGWFKSGQQHDIIAMCQPTSTSFWQLNKHHRKHDTFSDICHSWDGDTDSSSAWTVVCVSRSCDDD